MCGCGQWDQPERAGKYQGDEGDEQDGILHIHIYARWETWLLFMMCSMARIDVASIFDGSVDDFTTCVSRNEKVLCLVEWAVHVVGEQGKEVNTELGIGKYP